MCGLPVDQIWRIDTKYNILYVHGQAVPGPTHAYVRVFDTKLRYRRDKRLKAVVQKPAMPTFYLDDVEQPLLEELFADDLFQFNRPSITFAETEKAKKA